MKSIMLLFFIFFGVPYLSYAQTTVITGQITDQENSNPLPDVTVTIKGNTAGTTSNAQGQFSIKAAGNATLVFSYVGYLTKEVPVDNRSVVNIQLTADNKSLNEVVVIGYGKQKKINVIGSVATVSSKEITAAPVSSLSNALAGRLPGAVIQQGSGEPGNDAASILIRGSSTLGENQPLVVVDGIPGRDLNSINPKDVESISILKDASAAIYGARAANGVILVTTKRGTTGTPATFSYSFYTGLMSPVSLPKMADAPTYAQMLREMETYKGIAPQNMTFSQEDVDKFKSGKFPWTHPNTDWWDATLKKNNNTSHHDFSVSGGSKTVNYYLSFGTQYADGLNRNSAKSFNRYNLKGNVDVQVNKYLNVGIDLDGSQENRMGPSMDAGTIFNVTNQNKPTRFASYPNGMPGTGAFGAGYNPLLAATSAGGFDDDKRYRSNNKINATLKIPGIDGLSVSSYYAYDVFFGQRKLFEKGLIGYNLDKNSYLAAGNDGSQDGTAFLIPTPDNFDPRVTNYYSNSRLKTFNTKINYEKTINDVHNLSAFVAYENSEYNEIGISAFRRGFISSELPYLFAGANAEKDNSEYVSIDSRINYFGRLSYNYKETYLFQVAFRRDGSLRFSKESGRWGNFPSVLAGWIISNENFWKENIKFIDFLKIKASWGQMGNDLIPAFQYLASYAFSTGGVYGIDRVYSTSLTQSNAPNPIITWEVANIYNAGFESKFLDNKMSLNADFFYQRRNNILVTRNASVPQFAGISLPDENFGIVDNKGLEIELGYRGRSSNFNYSINGNFAYNHNKVVEFDEPAKNFEWQRLTGHRMGATLLYKSAGIFRDQDMVNKLPHVAGAMPGDVIIEDYNKDGQITNADKILFDKTTNPEITYGLSFNLSYKSFELSALMYGVGSNAWVRRLGSQQGSQGDYYQYDAEGRWTPENMDATKPRAYDGAVTYWRGAFATDKEYQNQFYARLKNVQLSYELPLSLVNHLFIKKAQVYVSGQNLFLIYSSKERIWDPEFSVDRDNYPLMKVMSVGARVSF